MEISTAGRARVLYGVMIKRLSEKYQQWNYLRKSKKTQLYSYRGVEIKILPGVFSPLGTRTTELFADYLLKFNWEGKKVLELGAGSGLISFLLSKESAKVTASDISENVIDGIVQNSKTLNLPVRAIHSDFFKQLNEGFDEIIINPPFFQKEPNNIAERAWYCGANFDYYQDLFKQFKERNLNEEIWMILSENSAVDTIEKIAETKGLIIVEKHDLTSHGEAHIVFKIRNK